MKRSSFLYALILTLSLGLAPFLPEPHIWKQIRNLATVQPMELMDWLDLVLHGAPWAWLAFELSRMRRASSQNTEH
jgi:hypothetical protein